jgi:hypothetical protein
MKTLSIQQPWAQLVVEGIKDVENRTWDTPYRGKLLIHASSQKVQSYFLGAIPVELSNTINNHCILGNVPDLWTLTTGAIIGYVDLVDIQDRTDSIWDDGGEVKKWIFRNAYLFDKPITGVKGKLHLFEYDLDEHNLPPAHRVALKEVSLADRTLTVPMSEADYEDFKENGVLDLFYTDALASMLCKEDALEVKENLFDHLRVLRADGQEEMFEVEQYELCTFVDDNDEPIIVYNKKGIEITTKR